MTQTVTVTQASIADLIEQRDELLEALKGLIAELGYGFKLHRQLLDAIIAGDAAIAKASPIAGLTEIGGCDEQ